MNKYKNGLKRKGHEFKSRKEKMYVRERESERERGRERVRE